MKDIGLLILRLAAGALMLPHGIKKLTKILEGKFAFADPIGIGEAPYLGETHFSVSSCCCMGVRLSDLLMYGPWSKW